MFFLSVLILSSLPFVNDSERKQLEKSEIKALKANIIDKEYIYDFTGKKGCNKSKIKYLGIAHDNKKKQYKVLTSFFVFSTSVDMCHATSFIKIYDLKNNLIGQYYVGDDEYLPDCLKNNKLLYLKNSKGCNLRKTGIIDLNEGLPKQIFIPCTKEGGDIFTFNENK